MEEAKKKTRDIAPAILKTNGNAPVYHRQIAPAHKGMAPLAVRMGAGLFAIALRKNESLFSRAEKISFFSLLNQIAASSWRLPEAFNFKVEGLISPTGIISVIMTLIYISQQTENIFAKDLEKLINELKQVGSPTEVEVTQQYIGKILRNNPSPFERIFAAMYLTLCEKTKQWDIYKECIQSIFENSGIFGYPFLLNEAPGLARILLKDEKNIPIVESSLMPTIAFGIILGQEAVMCALMENDIQVCTRWLEIDKILENPEKYFFKSNPSSNDQFPIGKDRVKCLASLLTMYLQLQLQDKLPPTTVESLNTATEETLRKFLATYERFDSGKQENTMSALLRVELRGQEGPSR